MSKIVWTPSKFDAEGVSVSVTVREGAEGGITVYYVYVDHNILHVSKDKQQAEELALSAFVMAKDGFNWHVYNNANDRFKHHQASIYEVA